MNCFHEIIVYIKYFNNFIRRCVVEILNEDGFDENCFIILYLH